MTSPQTSIPRGTGHWGTQPGGLWDEQKWLVCDFDGDSKADIANIFNDKGCATIDVFSSTGIGFISKRREVQSGGFGMFKFGFQLALISSTSGQ